VGKLWVNLEFELNHTRLKALFARLFSHLVSAEPGNVFSTGQSGFISFFGLPVKAEQNQLTQKTKVFYIDNQCK